MDGSLPFGNADMQQRLSAEGAGKEKTQEQPTSTAVMLSGPPA